MGNSRTVEAGCAVRDTPAPKDPGFAAVAILTLALGIGATTSIFTVVNALLLKPLPYKNSEQLVVLSTIFQRLGTDRGSVSYPDVADWKAQRDLFEGVSFFSQFNLDVTGGNQPERVRSLLVDDDYFRVLASPPQLGRTFTSAENKPGADRVVVLSHQLWMRRFGGDTNVLRQVMELAGVPHTIIGVMPKDSTWPEDVERIPAAGVHQRTVAKCATQGQPSVPYDRQIKSRCQLGRGASQVDGNGESRS